jgi:hypothetical protein
VNNATSPQRDLDYNNIHHNQSDGLGQKENGWVFSYKGIVFARPATEYPVLVLDSIAPQFYTCPALGPLIFIIDVSGQFL